jgi:hypothetical protein
MVAMEILAGFLDAKSGEPKIPELVINQIDEFEYYKNARTKQILPNVNL